MTPPPCPQPQSPCSPNGDVKRGLCPKHYRRWQRHGTIEALRAERPTGDDSVRWMQCIDHVPSGCWQWIDVKSHGYGNYHNSMFRTHIAHRFVYQLLVSVLTDEQQLDHLCRNRLCVNPDHLEPVTPAVNVQRGIAGDKQRQQTHCVNGHEFTPENTIRRSENARGCRECGRVAVKLYMRTIRGTAPDAIHNREKTHCPAGHAFEGKNLYVSPSGKRCCRACTREQQRRYQERLRAKTLGR